MIKRWVLAERTKIREECFGGIMRAPIQSAKIYGQSFYLLTPVEYRILELCCVTVTSQKISRCISEEFEADYEEVLIDVEEYLQKLLQLMVVTLKEEECDDCDK